MPREYIDLKSCPFSVGDRVRDDSAKGDPKPLGFVSGVDDEHVYVRMDSGRTFYRTWVYEQSSRGGGWLVRIDPALVH